MEPFCTVDLAEPEKHFGVKHFRKNQEFSQGQNMFSERGRAVLLLRHVLTVLSSLSCPW